MNIIGLTLTDTHLKEENIELVTDIWNQAVNYCIENKIKRIFFKGDFFTARKAQSLTVDEAGRKIINNVLDKDIDLYMIPGNHDKVDLESESSYLDEYKNYSGCKVITSYDTFQEGEVVIHFLPYFKESTIYPEKLDLAIANVKSINAGVVIPKFKHILLTHIAVTGVKNNDGTTVENNIGGSSFDVFHSVLVGHYHNRSYVEPNIFYVGSAYQANFGEDNGKGFTIIMEDGSHKFVQSKFKEFIKVKLDISDVDAIKEAEKEYKNTTDNVRFVFEGEEAELKNVSKEKFAAVGIQVDFNKYGAVPLNNEDLVEKASSVSFDRSNINSAFQVFCQTKHIEDTTIGEEYLSKI